MQIDPITPTIGADVHGIDLNTLDDHQFAAVRQALLDHQVLAFREQDLDPEAQLDFARRFGDIDRYPFTSGNRHFAPHPSGLDGLVRLEHDERNPGYENQWHIDMTWRAEPPMGSILRAVELPASGGGDTAFCNLAAVHASFDQATQDYLGTLSATHDWLKVFGRQMPPDDLARFRSELPMVSHPLVRTHPDTGAKHLFYSQPFVVGLAGLPDQVGRAWIGHLTDLINTPEFHCRVKWAPGTVVMWDNRAVAHYAVSDYYPERRVMDRVTIAGDKPYRSIRSGASLVRCVDGTACGHDPDHPRSSSQRPRRQTALDDRADRSMVVDPYTRWPGLGLVRAHRRHQRDRRGVGRGGGLVAEPGAAGARARRRSRRVRTVGRDRRSVAAVAVPAGADRPTVGRDRRRHPRPEGPGDQGDPESSRHRATLR
ncbi:MAG: TauD/TfdA family dioxygenase [Acidimicrobiales bacterium]